MARLFLAVSLTAVLLSGCVTGEAPKATPPAAQPAVLKSLGTSRQPYRLGIARYTFCERDLDSALRLMRDTDCHYLGLMSNTISFDATDAEIAAYKAKCKSYGVEVVSAGPLYFCTEEELEACMKFAKRYGMKYISVVPFDWNPKIAHCKTYEERRKILPDGRLWRLESDRMMDALDRCVKKYDLRAAVHNHGPDNAALYPTGEAALKRIGNRDRRIGVCLDVGHERRAGLDPVKFIRENGDRIVEVHLKNIQTDPVRNIAMPGPRGDLDIPGIFAALSSVGYAGYCLVEYERDFTCHDLPLAESVGYYRGVMDATRAKPVMRPVPAGANTLSAAEKADGWELLWDGRNLPDKWVGDGASKFERFPEKGWRWANGELWMLPVRAVQDGKWIDLPPEDARLGGGGSIQTRKAYRNFHFKVDFKLTEAANSGIKYFFNENLNSSSCEEFQILDRAHPDYDVAGGTHRIGALYDLLPAPKAEEVVRPLGHWNTAEVIAKGSRVEHWLNGVKVLEYERGGAAFRAAVAKSKYAKWGKDAVGKPQPWGELPEGRIHLQDHTDSKVYFCNIKIKEL